MIYYAGHGTEASAPPAWETGGSKIQMILPQNYSAESGSEVHGIPDRTIGTLLEDLAQEKGDNIVRPNLLLCSTSHLKMQQTVIFDCCFSGSGTRSYSTRLDRFEKIVSNIPTDLDREIWQHSRNGRGTQIAPGFLYSGLRSHVLLAACGGNETAREDRVLMRGDFTKALLETLRTVSVDKITYADLIQRIPQLPE